VYNNFIYYIRHFFGHSGLRGMTGADVSAGMGSNHKYNRSDPKPGLNDLVGPKLILKVLN